MEYKWSLKGTDAERRKVVLPRHKMNTLPEFIILTVLQIPGAGEESRQDCDPRLSWKDDRPLARSKFEEPAKSHSKIVIQDHLGRMAVPGELKYAFFHLFGR